MNSNPDTTQQDNASDAVAHPSEAVAPPSRSRRFRSLHARRPRSAPPASSYFMRPRNPGQPFDASSSSDGDSSDSGSEPAPNLAAPAARNRDAQKRHLAARRLKVIEGPWCTCGGPEHGDMIQCNQRCQFGRWFHIDCLDAADAARATAILAMPLDERRSAFWRCPKCIAGIAERAAAVVARKQLLRAREKEEHDNGRLPFASVDPSISDPAYYDRREVSSLTQLQFLHHSSGLGGFPSTFNLEYVYPHRLAAVDKLDRSAVLNDGDLASSCTCGECEACLLQLERLMLLEELKHDLKSIVVGIGETLRDAINKHREARSDEQPLYVCAPCGIREFQREGCYERLLLSELDLYKYDSERDAVKLARIAHASTQFDGVTGLPFSLIFSYYDAPDGARYHFVPSLLPLSTHALLALRVASLASLLARDTAPHPPVLFTVSTASASARRLRRCFRLCAASSTRSTPSASPTVDAYLAATHTLPLHSLPALPFYPTLSPLYAPVPSTAHPRARPPVRP